VGSWTVFEFFSIFHAHPATFARLLYGRPHGVAEGDRRMRESDEFVARLRRWYNRPFAPDLESCDEAPLFGDLVEFVRSQRPLRDAERLHISTCPRCHRTLAAIRKELGRSADISAHLAPRHRRWPAVATLATAAVLGFAFLIVQVDAFDLREIGYARPIPFAGNSFDATDSAAVDAMMQRMATARADLEQALTTGSDPWLPWTQLYRNLRALGRWDEALAEMHAFVEYACEEDRKPGRYTMYYSGLFDLGETYAALGDYDKAWDYHQQSLNLARDYLEWAERTGRIGDTSPTARAGGLASTLLPRLDALSTLAAAKGDMRSAWEYHNQATELLADYSRLECKERGLNASPSASLVELCRAVVADGGAPESPVVKVREHLLREARLHRLERNLDLAEQTLDAAATLPVYPFADESRLDFNEPVERLRIAIARGDFVLAIQHAEEAAQHTGPREFDGYPTHPPIGIVARAEVRFLKGVALAGLNRADPEAIPLIDAALQTVHAASSSLSRRDRERFLRSFAGWESVRNELR
jgi:tetratricopeptide (TPR) repeat protein